MIFGPGPLHERRCERGCCPFPNNGGEGEAVPGQSRRVLADGVQRTERARQTRSAGYGREMEATSSHASSEEYNVVVDDRGTSELELGDLIRHFLL